jgi:hypothetical protein
MHAFREKAKYVDRAARRLETRKVPAVPHSSCVQCLACMFVVGEHVYSGLAVHRGREGARVEPAVRRQVLAVLDVLEQCPATDWGRAFRDDYPLALQRCVCVCVKIAAASRGCERGQHLSSRPRRRRLEAEQPERESAAVNSNNAAERAADARRRSARHWTQPTWRRWRMRCRRRRGRRRRCAAGRGTRGVR